MCGIAGMVFLKNFERSEFQLQQIRFVFNELMVQTQERGKDATGIIHMHRDGSYDFYKSPVASKEAVTTDEMFKSIVANIGENTASIIAHTRWGTKGAASNNNNNHPFEVGNIMGVHNGTIANDDELFKKFEFPRLAQVDSEIIFHLINKYNEHEVTLDGLKLALEKSLIKGLFAIAFANKFQPNLVHIVKQERPMTLTYWHEVGVMIYNSQDDLIENALDTLTRAGNSFNFFPSITVESKTLKNDVYLTIDSDAEEVENMVSDPQTIYLLSSTVTTGYYDAGHWVGTGTGGNGTGGTGTRTPVSATDSIGRIIEGELDEQTGEVIIYTTSLAVVDDEDEEGVGSGEETIESCTECGIELEDAEINASYNASNPVNDRVCKSCYQEAVASVLNK